MTINKLRRKFGFNRDNIGIISRYIIEKEKWYLHIYNTKKIILENTRNKNKDICLIVGSGWCIDVPVHELSKIFKKVILVDIVHPKQTVHKMKNFFNVEFVTKDISGILEQLIEYKNNKNQNLYNFLRKQNEFFFIKNINPDFVVSVNILSQIAYFPLRYIKRFKLAPETELIAIQKFIEQKHLEMLPKGESLLISDYYEEEFLPDGKLINEKSRIAVQLPREKIIKEWIWDFDLTGNYYTGNPVKFKVVALQV